MDKYEYKLKIDQMKTLASSGNYNMAAEIADSINWRKVKNINLLMKAGDIYSKTERYDEARDILLMAYDRSPIGRMIIYRLAEISIKMKNFEEAEEYYDEFVEIAPHDNLKFVLRYKISKAKGTALKTQITILEELKEVEYTEEWAYELAYLYHQAGESEKCIDACDELILWFGDGIYVERALELKMLYQPLTKSQEDKYREFKQYRDGVKEVYPHGEETMAQIPVVKENMGKFDTMNLQEELAKSMQQIMEATEKETVEDTMDNIKKMVEEIPYLQMSHDDRELSEEYGHIETDAEIDGTLRVNFKEMLAEDYDGQISVMVPDKDLEPQMHGQMLIEEVLSEWEKTRRAAEAALQIAEQQKLESAKARALQEAEDIMERLSDVIPKLDAGITPSQLLKEEYLSDGNISNEERAGRIMAGMNDMLQQQIDRLQEETTGTAETVAAGAAIAGTAAAGVAATAAGMAEDAASTEHELLRKIKLAKPTFDEPIGIRSYIPNNSDTANDTIKDAVEESMPEIAMPEGIEDVAEEQMPKIAMPEGMEDVAEEPMPEIAMPEGMEDMAEEPMPEIAMPEGMEDMAEEPMPEIAMPEGMEDMAEEPMPEIAMPEDMEQPLEAKVSVSQATRPMIEIAIPEEAKAKLLKQDTKELKTDKITAALDAQMKRLESEGEDTPIGERPAITKLNDEQKAIFSYFVPVAGMEEQICQALTGASARLSRSTNSATGNILIQGGSGCGKTVLATGLIKALQKEVQRPNGKIGKIDAEALNKKDIPELLKKVAGGCLIIERAGEINRETAVKLSLLLESDTSGILVIMEDTRVGLNQALGRDEGLARKFTEKIKIPVFTSDELVEFGKAYANDLDYEIDAMGVLALYNRISNIQRLDRATTLTEVKEIVDEAIEKAEKKSLKKALSIITSRRYTEDDYVILREKDFEE